MLHRGKIRAENRRADPLKPGGTGHPGHVLDHKMQALQHALPLGLTQRHEAHGGRHQRASKALQIERGHNGIGQGKPRAARPSTTG